MCINAYVICRFLDYSIGAGLFAVLYFLSFLGFVNRIQVTCLHHSMRMSELLVSSCCWNGRGLLQVQTIASNAQLHVVLA